MIFEQLAIKDLWTIRPEPVEDDRGFFARVVCQKEFEEHGLPNDWLQQNITVTHKKGTFRGLHYQKGESAEIKVVRCTKGEIYDVAVDVREDSPTYRQWIGVNLSEDNHVMFYIPKGFAHGYITLTDNVEIHYLVSSFYNPGVEFGLNYKDPAINLKLPIEPELLSDKDKNWPFLDARK